MSSDVDLSLLAYLQSLPPAQADALYASRWTCAALLRALPPLAKQAVLRLVHVEEAVPAGALTKACVSRTLRVLSACSQLR